MFKSNLKINEFIKCQLKKQTSIKSKLTRLEQLSYKKMKEGHHSQVKKGQQQRKNSFSKHKSSISKSPKRKQSEKLPQKVCSKGSSHSKTKSNISTTGLTLNIVKKNLFKNSPPKEQTKNSKQKNKNELTLGKKKSLILSKNKGKNITRTNSITNLETPTTVTSATTTATKRVNNHTSANNEKKKKNDINKSNHFIREDFIYKPNITEICSKKLKNSKINNKNNISLSNKTSIPNYYLNELDLLSEDSVFNFSKQTSNNVTGHNSKEKYKTLSNNGESEQLTISYTYTDDEETCKSRTKRNVNEAHNKTYVIRQDYGNNAAMMNEDFLSFYEEMNKKLFAFK